jgi:hypothetical protein
MATKPDLNKLKSEIDSRKRERNIGSSPTGENIAPRDAFLFGLLESLQTGKETASSSLVKTVDNKVASKKGETTKLQISEVANTQQTQHIPMPNKLHEVDMSPERDEQLWAEVERKRKLTLAEQIGEYAKIPPVGTPMKQQGGLLQPTQINEQYLIENVNKIVNNYLSENLTPIFEEAIKSTILEMYAVERIKEVLQENREMIKSVVIETIKEIQARSKAKAQS